MQYNLNGTAFGGSSNFVYVSDNLGVGSSSPAYRVDVGGGIRANSEIIGTLATGFGQFRAVGGTTGFLLRNDGSNVFFMQTAAGDPYGSWNINRQIVLPLNSDNVYLSVAGGVNSGNVGIATTSPLSRLHVAGDVRSVSGQFLGDDANENATNPAFSWVSNRNTGMWLRATNEIGWSSAGNNRMSMTSSDLTLGDTGLSTTGFRLRPAIVPSTDTGSLNTNYGVIWSSANPGGSGILGNTGLVTYRGIGTNITTELYATGGNSEAASINIKAPRIINFELPSTNSRQVSIGWALASGPIAASGTVNSASRLAVSSGLSVYAPNSVSTFWNLLPDASNTLNFTTGGNPTTSPTVSFTSGGSVTATGDMRAPIFRLSNDTSSYWQTNEFVLRGNNPTIYFRDTNSNSAMLHCNDNLLYVLRGDVDTTTWTAVNGQWPLFINLTNNDLTSGGTIYAWGDVIAFYSDQRLKTDIEPLEDALDSVLKLRGVRYKSSELAAQFGYTDGATKIGVLAHEVQAVLPEAVSLAPFDRAEDGTSRSGENYLTVSYEKLIPLLIEAIKEQQSQIQALQAELDQLKGER